MEIFVQQEGGGSGGSSPNAALVPVPDDVLRAMAAITGIPERVVMAMQFVKLCNENMGLRGFMCGDQNEGKLSARIDKLDLHPAQEGCFRHALGCLSNYFNGKPM